MSVNEAAGFLNISKEAIHNRIRRGSIEVLVENGVKMVVLDSKDTSAKPRQSTVKVNNNNDKYNKLLEEQNAKLQERITLLENETRSLRDQKELMLIAEREKIEQIYIDKDEQLKNILATLSSQLQISAPTEDVETIDTHVEEEITEEIDDKSSLISLKKHLKNLDISDKKIKKIQSRFLKKSLKDERIISIGKKYYLDTSKYDYSDLIK